MINDAEKFADEDAKLKGKVQARNELESKAYSLQNQLSDKEKLGGKLSDEETAKIEEVRTHACTIIKCTIIKRINEQLLVLLDFPELFDFQVINEKIAWLEENDDADIQDQRIILSEVRLCFCDLLYELEKNKHQMLTMY